MLPENKVRSMQGATERLVLGTIRSTRIREHIRITGIMVRKNGDGQELWLEEHLTFEAKDWWTGCQETEEVV